MSSASATSTAIAPSLLVRSRLGSAIARLASDEMLRKSLLSLGDQAVVSATNFAITVLLGRMCGKPEVGLYYLALQIVFFARGIQEQLISAPYLVYAGRKQGHEALTYAGSNMVHACALLGGSMIAMLAAAAIGGVSTELSSVLWLLVGAMPLMLLREYVRQNAFAELRVTEAFLLDVAVCSLQLILLATVAYFGILDTFITYAVLASGCGVATIAWLVRRQGSFVVERQRVLLDWKHNWQFGRWALASQLLGCSVPYVLPWIVAGTHGGAATAALGVGTTLIGFANMFVLGLSNFICPRAARAFASGGKKDLVVVLKQAATMYMAILLPFAVAMLLAGDRLMTFVYGPEFADAGRILAVLAVGAVVNSLGITAGNGLWAMERPSANFRSDVCALVAWIIATALFVGPYGSMGAAIASVTGTIIGACVRIFTLMTQLRETSN